MGSSPTPTPRVWIGCLAAYNGGDLHGMWVDADDVDGLEAARAQVIRTSPVWARGELAEEHAVMDYDGFGDLASTLGEWPSFDTVAAIAQAIVTHGPAFIAYVDACEPDLNGATTSAFLEAFRGEWDSERDYAEYEIGEVGLATVERIPEALLPYLDMDMVVREIFRHGEMRSRSRPGGGVYVFDASA
jgi:antirestriction protein